ncbi:MAG: Holliday junction resolvase RuvX [Cardiobacteriaceae bacterium]|nr:Holliday junction resolvase RuvX [Cardiobacteriaceae bacterium]
MTAKWILALDVGQRKTGVAVGQTLTQTAKPIAVLRHPIHSLDANHFSGWVKEWFVSTIVIGLPQLRDGNTHPLAPFIYRLGEQCHEVFGLPVYFIDEYLSSHEARARLPKTKEVDAMAAAIIAEDWLTSNRGA